MTIAFDIDPPRLLRSPHLQTVLSSRVARGFSRVGRDLLDTAERITISCHDNVTLAAFVNSTATPAPLVIVLHGWLGNADSPYSRRAAHALSSAGFRVARLLLRDHGDTSALNTEMFHSARIDEVVEACNALSASYGNGRTGVLGFSLGGNFAVRVAAHPRCDRSIASVLAVCPVVDPVAAVDAIDNGWSGYRWWFLRKWRRALVAKQQAFPDRYDFTEAFELPTIAALTDYVVARHSEFPDAAAYYAAYRLTQDVVTRLVTPVHVVAALDDPVIPGRDIANLSATDALTLTLSPYGGHCAFIETFGLESRLDAAAPHYFARALGLCI